MSEANADAGRYWSSGGRAVLEGVLACAVFVGAPLLIDRLAAPLLGGWFDTVLAVCLLGSPLVVGVVAGLRAPGDLSRRVGAGLVAWLVVSVVFSVLAVANGVVSGTGEDPLAYVTSALLAVLAGFLGSGFGGLVGAWIDALADRGDGSALAGEARTSDADRSVGDTDAATATASERSASGILESTASLARASAVGAGALLAVTLAGLTAIGWLAMALVPFWAGILAGYQVDDGIGLGVLAGFVTGVVGTASVVTCYLLFLADGEYLGDLAGMWVFLFLFYPIFGVLSSAVGSLFGSLV